jgi:PLP dependent protein
MTDGVLTNMLIVPQISPADADLAARLSALRTAIARAAASAGRSEESITLIAVSKGHAAARVRAAAALGITDVGESYVQEAVAKRAALADLPLTWHFIGRLQANKTRLIAEQFDWVHGLERLHVAERLSAQRPAALPALNVCLQLNIAAEARKGGVDPAALHPLAAAIGRLPRLRLRGLMAILPAGLDAAANRRLFAAARAQLQDLNAAGVADADANPGTGLGTGTGSSTLDTLSMGMSEDFPAAIAEGATLIRIGTALFGPRAPAGAAAAPSTAGLG